MTIHSKMAFRIEELERQRGEILDALISTTASLSGAASAYRKHAKRHRSQGIAEPDPFFSTRADDFDRAVDKAREAINGIDDD